jgi:hypothetical protein
VTRAAAVAALGALAGLAAIGGCANDAAVTVDDILASVTIKPAPSGARIADGTTRLPIELCMVDHDGRDPSLAATLHASAGHWVDAADGQTLSFALTERCEQRPLIPPTDVGPLTVTATLSGYTRSVTADLVAAPVVRVRLGTTGVLSASADAMLTVTATLDVGSDGVVAAPSRGTEVAFDAQIEPLGAIGRLSDTVMTIATGNTVAATFFASPQVTRVTFTAIARPAGQAACVSSPLAVER